MLFLFLSPVFAHAEYINSFDSQIEVRKDGSFSVTETIDYVFTEEKHGIFRFIPLIHPEASEHFLKERVIEVSIESVKVDGSEVPYTEEGKRDQFYLKIGDPYITITGAHTYTIAYTVNGGLLYPKGQGAELYFNITGNGWEVPMKLVSARISSPDSLFLQNRSCYRDLKGSSASCAQTKQEDGSIVFRTTELMPGEGMTIAQALDTRNVERVIVERFKLLWILIPLGVLVVSALGVYAYRFKTKYKTGRVIIPQYEPYPGVKPMYAGMLFDRKLDPRDITAGIVYLAQQGFIKMKKIDRKVLFFFEIDDYEFELLRPLDDIEDTFEGKTLKLIFDYSPEVGKKVTLHQLGSVPSNRQRNASQIRGLSKGLEKDLKDQGFFSDFSTKSKGGQVFAIPMLILIILVFITQNIFTFIVLAVSLVVFASGRRTRKGYEALDHLKGFKLFLEMTDKERFDFHNAPEKSPEQFMEYLPYAIAFGVEEKWAKVFEGITIPNPGWYDGGAVSSFNATNLTTSLGAFSTAFAASSGASPSSGGGHSGGGSGGGGGGSW